MPAKTAQENAAETQTEIRTCPLTNALDSLYKQDVEADKRAASTTSCHYPAILTGMIASNCNPGCGFYCSGHQRGCERREYALTVAAKPLFDLNTSGFKQSMVDEIKNIQI